MKRTLANETIEKIDKKVTLKGWVDTIRDHGKITFIDLRDRSGKVQCVGADLPKLTNETVVEIVGKVVDRPAKLVNKDIKTGKIELQIDKLTVLSESKEQLPLPIEGDGHNIEEEVRLKYRYLDLRR
ncbi:OB-fold nucleic acid binding domain-containing protein, partial [Patescibacteria group bacterium]